MDPKELNRYLDYHFYKNNEMLSSEDACENLLNLVQFVESVHILSKDERFTTFYDLSDGQDICDALVTAGIDNEELDPAEVQIILENCTIEESEENQVHLKWSEDLSQKVTEIIKSSVDRISKFIEQTVHSRNDNAAKFLSELDQAFSEYVIDPESLKEQPSQRTPSYNEFQNKLVCLEKLHSVLICFAQQLKENGELSTENASVKEHVDGLSENSESKVLGFSLDAMDDGILTYQNIRVSQPLTSSRKENQEYTFEDLGWTSDSIRELPSAFREVLEVEEMSEAVKSLKEKDYSETIQSLDQFIKFSTSLSVLEKLLKNYNMHVEKEQNRIMHVCRQAVNSLKQ